ncbi:MAG: hypothetical protein K0U47_12635 [Epsilonproteobacteria bacterium]|nr:hypothetical protein [Campylobacterota bacterium]
MKKLILSIIFVFTTLYADTVYEDVGDEFTIAKTGYSSWNSAYMTRTISGDNAIFRTKNPELHNLYTTITNNGNPSIGYFHHCTGGQQFSTTTGTCQCPNPEQVFTNGVCTCPVGTESAPFATCPPTPHPPSHCVAPCPEGQSRNQAGSCCPSGLGLFCNTETHEWSDCQCPEGSDAIPQGDGTFLCDLACDEGFERGEDGECQASCNICEEYKTNAELACQANEQYLYNFTCTPNEECSDAMISGQCISCTECVTRESERKIECSQYGAYVEGFQCGENPETCEVTNYNQGECIDDDTNPNDPNFGDGSQSNNDETNDIPDINNTAIEKTDANGDTKIDLPDYNPAFESIGDNIEDNRKAINAQTKANKQNAEFLSDKLDKIEANTKDIKDALTSDGSGISKEHTPNQEFDKAGFKEIITNELNQLSTEFTNSINHYWDNISSTYFERDYFIVNDCPTMPTLTFTIQNKEVVLISQERFDSYGIFPIFKKIIIFLFILSGILYAFRSE